MKKLLILLFSCSLLTTACKKSKDAPPPPPPPELTMKNVAGAYKIIADTTTSAEGITADVYANYQSCAKDDIWNFNSDSTIDVVDEGVVCDPSDGWSGTWSLTGDSINVYGMGGTVTKWDGSIMEITLLYEDQSKDKITFKK